MRTTIAVAIACFGLSSILSAQDTIAAIRQQTDIAPQGLGPALKALARARNVELVYRSDLIKERQTGGAVGDLTFEEAMTQLLVGTGLTYKFLADNAITIVPINALPAADDGVGGGGGSDAGDSAPAAGSRGDSAETAGTGQLEEIIVTAQKVQESAQRTAISMTVYDEQSLAQRGVNSVADLATIDPSLQVVDSGVAPYIALRGVSSNNATQTFNPSVPVVIDDFTSNRPKGLLVSMFDLQRVEVLRGPQGTLYGRSATGGVINVISNKPSNEFSAQGSVEFGNYNAFNTSGSINVPVSDSVQMRAAFQTLKHDGYHGRMVDVDRLVGDDNRADDEDSRAGRFQIAVQPTDWFRALFQYDQVQIGGFGMWSQSLPAVAPVPNVMPTLQSADDYPIYGRIWQDGDQKVARWNLEFSGLPGGASVSFLGGYGQLKWRQMWGGSNNYTAQLADPASPHYPYLPARQTQVNEYPDTLNAELRLTSGSDSPLTYQAGLYYFEETNDPFTTFLTYAPGGTGLEPPAGATGLNGIEPGDDIYQVIYTEVKQTSKAAFAQASYAFNDQNKITLGVRYNEDESSQDGFINTRVGPFPPAYLLPPGVTVMTLPQPGSGGSNRVTWHAGYDLQLTDQNLVYLKVDEGYKPGGVGACGPFGPESVLTGEVGTKNRFFDQRMQLNGAVFYNEYTDQQVSSFTPACIAPQTTNAGESEIYGAEIGFTALATPVDRIDLNLSWLHARFVTFLTPSTFAPCSKRVGTQCDLEGNTLTGAPDFTVTAGYEHDFALAEGNLNFRLQGKYLSKQYFEVFNAAYSEQEAYGLVDAYLTYVRDQWQIGLWGRNLSDETYLTSGGGSNALGASQYSYTFGAPRTFGVRFEVRTQ